MPAEVTAALVTLAISFPITVLVILAVWPLALMTLSWVLNKHTTPKRAQ